MACDLNIKSETAWPAFPVTLREAVGAQVGGVLYAGLGTAGQAWYALDVRSEPKSWRRLADFPAEAPSGAASAVANGKIYVFGGAGRAEPSSSLAQFDVVHCYEPVSDSWAKLPVRLPTGMLGASAICVDGKHIWVFGGYNKPQFDSFFAKYESLGALQQKRALREFMDRPVLEFEWNANVWQFDVTSLEWRNLGSVPHLPNCGSGAISHQGQIYLLSGEIKPGLRSISVKRASISDRGLKWCDEKSLPSPDGGVPQEGVAGGFAGRWGEYLVLAGGTNFPGARRRYDAMEYYAHQGLSKTWRDELYVFRDDVWIMAGRLPAARANGLSFQVAEGLLLVGGIRRMAFLARNQCCCPTIALKYFPRTQPFFGEIQVSTKVPAYRQVQIEIKKYIKENNLKFGDGLPPEALLAKNLGVSRPSLREAVKSLESLGIVESRHGEGIFVKEFTFDSIVENLPYSMNEGDENVKKLLHVRKYLELGAIPAVVEHIDDESIQRLRVLAERMLSKALDKQTFAQEDREFHAEMYSCLKNDFLLSLIDLFWNVFNEMNQSSESVDHWALEETAKDHLRVVNMLEKKDVFGVLSAHREHFQAIVDTYPEE